uniref:Uncharacterized protein n=2 Tax=Micrurus surinamensis TaxID=129470 RepID=A0A2D4PCJ8_MICSU
MSKEKTDEGSETETTATPFAQMAEAFLHQTPVSSETPQDNGLQHRSVSDLISTEPLNLSPNYEYLGAKPKRTQLYEEEYCRVRKEGGNICTKIFRNINY